MNTKSLAAEDRRKILEKYIFDNYSRGLKINHLKKFYRDTFKTDSPLSNDIRSSKDIYCDKSNNNVYKLHSVERNLKRERNLGIYLKHFTIYSPMLLSSPLSLDVINPLSLYGVVIKVDSNVKSQDTKQYYLESIKTKLTHYFRKNSLFGDLEVFDIVLRPNYVCVIFDNEDTVMNFYSRLSQINSSK